MMDQPESRTVTREDLYQQVWTTPMRHLAKTYGLSDVGLRKLCVRHEIPTPPNGYWAKLQWGKPVEQPALPTNTDPQLATISFGPASVEETRPLRETFFDAQLGELAAVEERGEMPIEVSATLRSPHWLVVRTQEFLTESWRRSASRDWTNFSSRYADQWRLAVSIGRADLSRAMRILDALLKGFERRGYKIVETRLGQRPHGYIDALGLRFTMRLREPSVRNNHVPTAEERERIRQSPQWHSVPKWDYTPSGQLHLDLVYDNYNLPLLSLRDGKTKTLEEKVRGIPLALLRKIDDDRRQAAAGAEERRRRREEEERQRVEEQRRKEEEARVQALHAEVDRWDRASRIRRYLEAVRQAAIEYYGFIEPEGELDQNLAWAEAVADQLDPLTPMRSAVQTRSEDEAESSEESFRRHAR